MTISDGLGVVCFAAFLVGLLYGQIMEWRQARRKAAQEQAEIAKLGRMAFEKWSEENDELRPAESPDR